MLYGIKWKNLETGEKGKDRPFFNNKDIADSWAETLNKENPLIHHYKYPANTETALSEVRDATKNLWQQLSEPIKPLLKKCTYFIIKHQTIINKIETTSRWGTIIIMGIVFVLSIIVSIAIYLAAL